VLRCENRGDVNTHAQQGIYQMGLAYARGLVGNDANSFAF
jgi:hypothetical protein